MSMADLNWAMRAATRVDRETARPQAAEATAREVFEKGGIGEELPTVTLDVSEKFAEGVAPGQDIALRDADGSLSFSALYPADSVLAGRLKEAGGAAGQAAAIFFEARLRNAWSAVSKACFTMSGSSKAPSPSRAFGLDAIS